MGEKQRRMKKECIIVNKVFDSCFQRECDPNKVVEIPCCTTGVAAAEVTFHPGKIVEDSLIIKRLNCKFVRVRFCFRVPFVVKAVCNLSGTVKIVNDYVEFCKDIKLYLPEAPDEFNFRIIIETRSKVLDKEIIGNEVILSIGVFVITKVVGRVQLEVLSTGYCPPPCECDEFSPEDICGDFNQQPLPPFYPPQKKKYDC